MSKMEKIFRLSFFTLKTYEAFAEQNFKDLNCLSDWKTIFLVVISVRRGKIEIVFCSNLGIFIEKLVLVQFKYPFVNWGGLAINQTACKIGKD